MNLYPLNDVAKNAAKYANEGVTIHQQWLCSHCHVKQTMGEANIFYTCGECEECGQVTDIARDGCNFVAVINVSVQSARSAARY